MGHLVQIAGALLVLAGFALAQLGVLDSKSRIYLVLNLVGSGVLALDALAEQQWGFLLLEGVWAAVSLAGLAVVLRRAVDAPTSARLPFSDRDPSAAHTAGDDDDPHHDPGQAVDASPSAGRRAGRV